MSSTRAHSSPLFWEMSPTAPMPALLMRTSMLPRVDLCDSRVDGGSIADVAPALEMFAAAGGCPVKDRNPGSRLVQKFHGRGADAAGSSGHDRGQFVEVIHGCLGVGSTSILGRAPRWRCRTESEADGVAPRRPSRGRTCDLAV
jgi:hypothetical protein